jgi:ring-1,2-phenylacetyl-CoA epoxidase subunit PaaC
MFDSDEIEQRLVAEGIAADVKAIEPQWNAMVSDVLTRATLKIPEQPRILLGGRQGRHTEHLGHMLSEMQIVARSHPGAEW